MSDARAIASAAPLERNEKVPTVSVIIATYNRSHTLRHAIQSVRDSSFREWELIVVGDACTDDSAECVASFADPRISFVNLPDRCGDQSGPNNRGIELSRGRYIAFLNHDDLYLSNHLALCVAALEESGADLVWVPCAVAIPRSRPAADELPCDFRLMGVPVGSRYTPFGFYFASSWVLRRDIVERIGPWPAADRTFVAPSQAWFFRASRSGATLRFLPTVSVIAVPAAFRPGSYSLSESSDHEWLARWRREEPRWRERMLEAAAVNEAMQRLTFQHFRPLGAIRRLLAGPIQAVLTLVGIHPQSLDVALRFGPRGRVIRTHRRRSGAV